jgi:predicted amidohydrolase/ribosomal protein S18 acetylase RimI-like enzyme
MSQEPSQTAEHSLLVRPLRPGDAADVRRISETVYARINSSWTEQSFLELIEKFPEGQIGVENHGEIIAFAFSLIVDYDKYGDSHTYDQITGNFTFSTHDPDGDVLYGIEVCVDPSHQGLRLGRRLYDARKEVCENLNLRAIVAGGRMPNYNKHKGLTPRQYIDQVRRKEIYDPVMTFQLSNDFRVKKVLTNYLGADTESKAYATLLEWLNISYQPKPAPFGSKTFVRMGVVQLEMRPMPSINTFYEMIEFYIDAVSGYKADFVCFPEYVNAPLMAAYNADGPPGAIRGLASHTREIRDWFIRKAVEYNINIITGSMPLCVDERLYNVVYLCRRDGSHEVQYKIHITPTEQNDWGMIGGDKVQVFDTDAGKVAMLICYDSEFPELGRILADQGVEILFIPFCTDTSTGYHRVRYCSQARAIENECFVVIAGSVGNLPKVVNMDIQYAQSAVFSPSDFAFGNKGIVTEATNNTETTLIADIDLTDLAHLHTHGSVRNLKQRRTDLYSIEWKKK